MAEEKILNADRRVYALYSGRKITFINVHKEADGVRGYSSKKKKSAYLYKNGFIFDGEMPINAALIEG